VQERAERPETIRPPAPAREPQFTEEASEEIATIVESPVPGAVLEGERSGGSRRGRRGGRRRRRGGQGRERGETALAPELTENEEELAGEGEFEQEEELAPAPGVGERPAAYENVQPAPQAERHFEPQISLSELVPFRETVPEPAPLSPEPVHHEEAQRPSEPAFPLEREPRVERD
jgi:ribonuclease E